MMFGTPLTTREKIICTAAVAVGALAVYLWHIHFADPIDSPILVRDGGSIILESPRQDALDDFIDVDDDQIVHPRGSGRMDLIVGTPKVGIAQSATCRKTARCRLVVTYSDGEWIRVISGKRGKGMVVKSSKKFSDWNLVGTTPDPRKWKLQGTQVIQSAVVSGTDSDRTICTGEGCVITVNFKD